MINVICSGVEQLVARQVHTLEVAGSSPVPTTYKQGGTPREQHGGTQYTRWRFVRGPMEFRYFHLLVQSKDGWVPPCFFSRSPLSFRQSLACCRAGVWFVTG